MNKLAYAVAMHETKNCGLDYGSSKYNNCFGIIRNGQFERYETAEDSYKDFKQLWEKYYKKYPDWYLADKYSGGDKTQDWLNNVAYFYNN